MSSRQAEFAMESAAERRTRSVTGLSGGWRLQRIWNSEASSDHPCTGTSQKRRIPTVTEVLSRFGQRTPYILQHDLLCGFHFSPARYHRLMQVVKLFQQEDSENADLIRPWNQADCEGWLSVLPWQGVENREATWQRRYFSLVGSFLYVLESPDSKSYKQCLSEARKAKS